MSINSLIINILKTLKIPVELHTYKGQEETYITFFTYLEQPEYYSDDDEEVTGYYIQIDLWSKRNLEILKNDVVNLLVKNKFIKRTINDLYEPETKLYHKCCRFFFYTKKLEEKLWREKSDLENQL